MTGLQTKPLFHDQNLLSIPPSRWRFRQTNVFMRSGTARVILCRAAFVHHRIATRSHSGLRLKADCGFIHAERPRPLFRVCRSQPGAPAMVGSIKNRRGPRKAPFVEETGPDDALIRGRVFIIAQMHGNCDFSMRPCARRRVAAFARILPNRPLRFSSSHLSRRASHRRSRSPEGSCMSGSRTST